ncbi:DUF4192 family protein [Pseudarthrobacter sp. So.54]
MLDAKSFPNEEQIIGLIAGLQFPTIRDQLMADIPGILEPGPCPPGPDEQQAPMVLLEWAEHLLLHAYTHSSTGHSALILTAIAFINWREGQGSKAHQFLHLALEADPGYHLARLSEPMTCSGSVTMSCRSRRIPA